MATLFLFIGFPGAGKTTVAQIVADATGAKHLWADYVRQSMFGEPTYSPEESQELYNYLNAETRRLLSEGQSVVFDTNFNFRKDRDHMRLIANEVGADIKLIWVRTAKEVARHRAVNESHDMPTRVYGNMHTDTFERIAGRLEAPTPDEAAIEIIGENLQKSDVLKALGLL